MVPSPDSDEKLKINLSNWASTERIQFVSSEAKANYEERCQIIIDVIQMEKTPKRILISPSAGHFPLQYYGYTWKEAMYDYKKLHEPFLKFNVEFDSGTAASGGGIPSGKILEILGYNPYVWAGHGLGDNEEFQYIENEYMKADEYRDFIDDPTGRLLTTYLPRCCSSLEGLPLHKGADGFMSDEQFNTIYWPSLRKLTIGLIDAGMVPVLFAEGSYNTRLEAVNNLPKGKVIWYFDKTDMKQAKETVGKNNCIMGNVPLDLLFAGSVEDVNDYCRKLIKVAGKDGGFIFSTGAGMQNSKPDNVKAMINCGKKYGIY